MRMQHSDNDNKDVNLDPRLDPKCADVRGDACGRGCKHQNTPFLFRPKF